MSGWISKLQIGLELNNMCNYTIENKIVGSSHEKISIIGNGINSIHWM